MSLSDKYRAAPCDSRKNWTLEAQQQNCPQCKTPCDALLWLELRWRKAEAIREQAFRVLSATIEVLEFKAVVAEANDEAAQAALKDIMDRLPKQRLRFSRRKSNVVNGPWKEEA